MIKQSLSPRARDLLSNAPPRGGGLHNWIFRTALELNSTFSKEIVISILHSLVGPSVRPGEIERAVKNSQSLSKRPRRNSGGSTSQKWPAPNSEQREAVVAAGAELVDLWEASPVRLDIDMPETEEIIDCLFPGNPWLCVGKSMSVFRTRKRAELRETMAGLQLIVPSPMSEQIGLTQDGKTSEHTLANTGPRRFLVIEYDTGTIDEQAAILLHLATKAPLALAVHSGNKSIHGWFFCAGQSEEAARMLMNQAVILGADRATWTRSQFVRMPGGRRDDGTKQPVYFFNPGVIR